MAPFTSTLPVVGASWQRRWTVTPVVASAVTENGAEPMHWVLPDASVDVSAMVKPAPAGRPPIVAEIVALWLTSIDPERAKPAGPPIT